MAENTESRHKSDESRSMLTYQKTTGRYPQFKAGIALIIVLILGFIYDMFNLYLWIDFGCGAWNILAHIFIGAVLLGALYPAYLLMRSGGKRDLIDHADAILSIFPDHLSLRYRLSDSEKRKYRAVRINLYFCDVTDILFQHDFQRLSFTGDYTVEQVPLDGKSFDDAEVLDISGKNFFLYDQFEDFEEIMTEIEEKSFRKIRRDDNLLQ